MDDIIAHASFARIEIRTMAKLPRSNLLLPNVLLALKSELWQSNGQTYMPTLNVLLALKSELWQSTSTLVTLSAKVLLALKSELWQSIQHIQLFADTVLLALKSELWQSASEVGATTAAVLLALKSELWQSSEVEYLESTGSFARIEIRTMAKLRAASPPWGFPFCSH